MGAGPPTGNASVQTFGALQVNKPLILLVADAVAIEPVSAANSLLTGKFTGNF
jgi:hypothetical protein